MKTIIDKSVIEITTVIGCKVACAYCPQKKFVAEYRKRSDIMSFDVAQFRHLLDRIPKDVEIYFCGYSEPFAHPDCAGMVSYARQQGHKTSVETTLVGMTVDDLAVLRDVPLEFLAVHLPSDEGYEQIRVDREYLDLLDAMINGGLKYRFLYLHYYGEKLHRDIRGLNAHRIPLYTRGGSVMVDKLGAPYRQKGAIGCKRGLRYNMLLPNGDIVLCSTDWELKHVIGNLHSDDYESLCKTPEFRKIVDGLKDDGMDILCRTCELHTFDKSLYAKLANMTFRLKQKLHQTKFK